MLALRKFTRSDWDAFAGAAKLSDGTGPWVGDVETPHAVVIVSGFGDIGGHNGIEVTLKDDVTYTITGMTPAMALHVALNMKPVHLTPFWLNELGFERVN